jgi:hypothetical protein
MKVLCAISSCESYETPGLNLPLRETWLSELPKIGWDYRFFHGNGATAKDDVMLVSCDDAYYDLTSKTKAKVRYALDRGYDFIFCCFPDTYACPERLLTCGFDSYDYFGDVFCHPGGNPYCQGGAGYFLSRKAMEIVANSSQNYSNEDCFCGDLLNRPDIRRGDHKGFTYAGPGPLRNNTSVTVHLSTQPCGYTGENMRAAHRDWINS